MRLCQRGSLRPVASLTALWLSIKAALLATGAALGVEPLALAVPADVVDEGA